MRNLIIFVILCFSICVDAAWIEDYQEGVKSAKLQGKPMLVVVVAGEECPWSVKLQTDVLSNPDFLNPLQNEIVLIKQRVKNSEEVVLGIEDYPALILFDSMGKMIAQRSYMPLEATEWARQLKCMFQDYSELKTALAGASALDLKALKKLYVKAKKAGCKEFQQEFLELGIKTDKGIFFPIEKYQQFIRAGHEKSKEAKYLKKTILSRDPDNQKRSRFSLALLSFQSRADRRRGGYTPKQVIEPLLDYVKHYGKRDSQGCWQAEMVMAQYLRNHNLLAQAQKHAKRAYRAAPDGAKPELQNLLTGALPK